MENYVIGICIFGFVTQVSFIYVLFTGSYRHEPSDLSISSDETDQLIRPEYDYIV